MNTLEVDLRSLTPALPARDIAPPASTAAGERAVIVPPPFEQLAEVATHALGLLVAAGASAHLLACAEAADSPLAVPSTAFYAAALLLVFAASSFYHAVDRPALRRFGQLVDQCAIFGLIAGTYAPLTLLGMEPAVGRSLLGFVAVISCSGIVLRVAGGRRGRAACLVLYLVAGWSLVAVYPAASAMLPPDVLRLVGQGGVAYTAGVAFFLCRRPFCHAVWHLFVLAGAGLHFVAVYRLLGV